MASNAQDSDAAAHPFATLSPDRLLDIVEGGGFAVDGRLTPLPSYENRVYQVGVWDAEPIVVKIYRPDRWTAAQIGEEHAFLAELAAEEIPVVAPLPDAEGRTLHSTQGFLWCAWPRRQGRAPEVDDLGGLTRIGTALGRLHAVGARMPFSHRPTLSVQEFGHAAAATVLASEFLPEALRSGYENVTAALLPQLETALATVADSVRLHGDLHLGNVLWRDDQLAIVDLDDARNGPPVQDLWMLLAGDSEQVKRQLDALLQGYELFREFDDASLALVEPLRTLRLMHHSAWIARRWTDPAFPTAFPWFERPQYWQEQVRNLEGQAERLAEHGGRPW